MKSFNWKKWLGYGTISIAYALSTVFCIIAIVVTLFANGSRSLLNYLLDGESGEWMYVHPIDIFIDLFMLIKTRLFSTNLMESYQKSDPSDIGHSGDDSSDES